MNTHHDIAGHKLTLLRNGEEYFPRLIEVINSAQRSVIWKPTFMRLIKLAVCFRQRYKKPQAVVS